MGNIPESVQELLLIESRRVTNNGVANIIMDHQNIDRVEIRNCVQIDEGCVFLINHLINNEQSQRGLYMKIINDYTVLPALPNLDLEVHFHDTSFDDCCRLQFYQRLIVIECSTFENIHSGSEDDGEYGSDEDSE